VRDFRPHLEALLSIEEFYEERLRLVRDGIKACEAEDTRDYEVAMVLLAEQEAPPNHDFDVDIAETRQKHWN
jgi:hypothetical protein